jgi:hypothetical protein
MSALISGDGGLFLPFIASPRFGTGLGVISTSSDMNAALGFVCRGQSMCFRRLAESKQDDRRVGSNAVILFFAAKRIWRPSYPRKTRRA